MKKVYFETARQNKEDKGTVPPIPWWKRLWPYAIIVLLLLLLLLLFRQCTDNYNDTIGDSPRKEAPDVPDVDNPNLPPPEDNRISPVNPDDIIADEDSARYVVKDKLNVILDSTADKDTFKKWANEFKKHYPSDEYSVIFYDTETKLIQITVPSNRRKEMISELPKKISSLKFKVFPEGILSNDLLFNKPVLESPNLGWFYEAVQAREAWKITKGAPDIVVAVVDCFFDLKHDDLKGKRIVHPYNVETRTSDVMPTDLEDFHGTFVASLTSGNGKGVVGIAPKCKFMPVCVGKKPTSLRQVEGVLYAINHGANVINVSIGYYFSPAISSFPPEMQVRLSKKFALEEEDVWNYIFHMADERNITIVWAAGNQNIYTGLDPSKRNASTIRVSATARKNVKAEYSNYGNIKSLGVHASNVSAPGSDIMGAIPFNDYGVYQGTSFAAPITAGAVALMKSVNPKLTNKEIIEILETTGAPVENATNIGPLIRIKDALDEVSKRKKKQ